MTEQDEIYPAKGYTAGEPEAGGPTCRLDQPHDDETDSDDEPGFSRLGGRIPEGEDLEPEEAHPPMEVKLQEAEALAEKHRSDYLRVLAEMDNLRKRTAREVEQTRRFAIEGFARDLLPVADNLERALGAIHAQGDGEAAMDPAIQRLADGVRLIQNELNRSFGKHGLVRIEAVNTPFDPHLHQAMMQTEQEGAAPGTVVQELQPGYLLNDRLLRPAMVSVTKGV